MDISFKVTDIKGHFFIFTVVFSAIFTRRGQNEHNPGEIILAWPNMRTYQNLWVAHARFVDDVLSDEYYQQITNLDIKHIKNV